MLSEMFPLLSLSGSFISVFLLLFADTGRGVFGAKLHTEHTDAGPTLQGDR